jgi:hypothetical protein
MKIHTTASLLPEREHRFPLMSRGEITWTTATTSAQRGADQIGKPVSLARPVRNLAALRASADKLSALTTKAVQSAPAGFYMPVNEDHERSVCDVDRTVEICAFMDRVLSGRK